MTDAKLTKCISKLALIEVQNVQNDVVDKAIDFNSFVHTLVLFLFHFLSKLVSGKWIPYGDGGEEMVFDVGRSLKYCNLLICLSSKLILPQCVGKSGYVLRTLYWNDELIGGFEFFNGAINFRFHFCKNSVVWLKQMMRWKLQISRKAGQHSAIVLSMISLGYHPHYRPCNFFFFFFGRMGITWFFLKNPWLVLCLKKGFSW